MTRIQSGIRGDWELFTDSGIRSPRRTRRSPETSFIGFFRRAHLRGLRVLRADPFRAPPRNARRAGRGPIDVSHPVNLWMICLAGRSKIGSHDHPQQSVLNRHAGHRHTACMRYISAPQRSQVVRVSGVSEDGRRLSAETMGVIRGFGGGASGIVRIIGRRYGPWSGDIDDRNGPAKAEAGQCLAQ